MLELSDKEESSSPDIQILKNYQIKLKEVISEQS